jgi:hypothetical protein
MVDIHMMKSGGFVKLFTTPVMQGMFPVPGVAVPVVIAAPVSPVATELAVVYVMISRRQSEDVFRWNDPDRRRDKGWLDENPGSIVDAGPEPVPLMEAEPNAVEEIKTYGVRD